MSSNYSIAIDRFIQRFRATRNTILTRIWMAFMAYSMCIVTEAFRARGYVVTPMNYTAGFRFKCFPAGNPNEYSYFVVTKDTDCFEIRLSIDARNLLYNSLKLNLDVAIIEKDSINVENLVDANHSLISFLECKNYRGFPELVATLEGMAYELQRSRLYQPHSFRIPACLLLSQSGNSILFMDRRYMYKGIALRIFDYVQPGHPNIQNFVRTWF